jgi:predicted cobalt transporter CbtA
MVRTLLARGMLVGIVSGVLTFVFAYLVGEPEVAAAVAFEERAASEDAGPELVSRTVQSTWGLATATIVTGVALGGIFALAYAFAYGRVGRLGARPTAGLLALGAFVTVELVPFLKYPANPPASGRAETIGHRTALYFAMVLFSVLAGIAALWLGRRLTKRTGPWRATLLAAASFVVVIGLVATLLPGIDEVPEAFPASLLWRFRLASLATQLVLWAVLGLLFGELTERAAHRVRAGGAARLAA